MKKSATTASAGPADLSVTPERVAAILEELLPISEGLGQLEVITENAGVFEAADKNIIATLRIYTYDEEDGARGLIRNIKEQQVTLLRAAHRGNEARVRAYLTGWAAAVRAVFSAPAEPDLDAIMPSDLASPKVLNLAKARTPEDFERALLVRSRLGKLKAAS